MTTGLDGIERFVETINPETLLFDQYVCSGYYNTARFVGDKLIPGKLVDWYRPISGKGEHHSLEFLELIALKEGRPLEIKVKGEGLYERRKDTL